MSDKTVLPALPEPARTVHPWQGHSKKAEFYTADQMREYASATLAEITKHSAYDCKAEFEKWWIRPGRPASAVITLQREDRPAWETVWNVAWNAAVLAAATPGHAAKDIAFLEEIKDRLSKARRDWTQADMIETMIDDWLAELKSASVSEQKGAQDNG